MEQNNKVPTEFSQTEIYKFTSSFPNVADRKGIMVKVNGEYVKLSSGKSIWKTKGHAKSALKNHCNFFNNWLEQQHPEVGYWERNQLWKNFLAFAEKKRMIEFVELS